MAMRELVVAAALAGIAATVSAAPANAAGFPIYGCGHREVWVPMRAKAVVCVQPGETLWELAAWQYGDGRLWQVIARANGVRDPRLLHAGRVLVIPRR